MDIHKIMEAASAQSQNERAATQMTLGELILTLKALPKNRLIDGLSDPHSYRGYYADLAFESYTGGQKTVKETLKMVNGCLNVVFTGYKGGEFTMKKNTPIWLASYGHTGLRIIRLASDGSFDLTQDV